MSAIRIGVLALQGDVREHARVLAETGAEPVSVRRPAELDSVAGLVLPGGESTTMSKLLIAFDLLGPVRDRVQAGMPVFGSCAGMILLADRIEDGTADQQTIGGMDVTVRRNAFGRQVESFEADIDITGMVGGPVHAVFIRAPWVEQVGPQAEAIGRVVDAKLGDKFAPQASLSRIVAVRQRHLLATSFHPELTGDPRVHAYFGEMVKEYTV
ncbi:MAG: pyridoxal 5'-phosphate synthase glutaminase subunit PdxT [Jatrophihabitans sp.]